MRDIETFLHKTPTGIVGLDEILGGGLPQGRATLVCGTAGCGKTLLGMEFLIRGLLQFDEPGVFACFEETEHELSENVASLGFDLGMLTGQGKLFIDHIHVAREEIQETGEFDLEGLFIRLGSAIDSIGAKRIVLDTVESLFSGLPNPSILRAELRRLFRWLKDKGVTAIITGERGEGALTRQGLEEYVSDCVIVLDHRVVDQLSTRRLRVVKYRGSTHGTNEYPFLIDASGFSVLPISSVGLEHSASDERIGTGIPPLDAMLGGHGYYRGSTVLVSGTAGTGKSSITAHFVDAAARRGERALYFAFEESPAQIQRNMCSIGIDLGQWVNRGLLQFHAVRPTTYGLEMHLLSMFKTINEFHPTVVALDPVSTFLAAGTELEAKAMLTRLIDILKAKGITALLTNLTTGGEALERTDAGISSLIDTWLLLRDIEIGGKRNRGLYVLKSRGMAHSNQIREFLLTEQGVQLIEAYIGPAGVLTGSARLTQEAEEKASRLARRQEFDRLRRDLERKERALDAQITALRAAFESEKEEVTEVIRRAEVGESRLEHDRGEMAKSRHADR